MESGGSGKAPEIDLPKPSDHELLQQYRLFAMHRPGKPNLCIAQIKVDVLPDTPTKTPLLSALDEFFCVRACISGSRFRTDNSRHRESLQAAGLVANHELAQLVDGLTRVLVAEGVYTYPPSRTTGFSGNAVRGIHGEPFVCGFTCPV